MAKLANTAVLSHIRSKRGYSISSAAEQAHIAEARLQEIESGEDTPSRSELSKLAHTYAVPRSLFFSKRLPDLTGPPVDFRTRRNRPAQLSGEGVRALELTRQIQRYAEEIIQHDSSVFKTQKLPKIHRNDPIEKSVETIRSILSLGDPSDFKTDTSYHNFIRTRIENLGIFCLYLSFGSSTPIGFCLSVGSSVPIITVNKRHQTVPSRIFTLLHEFVHLLLGEDGVSDPYNRTNSTERYCNKIAACVLAPEETFKPFAQQVLQDRTRATLSDIAPIARRFWLSDQATALRLSEVGLAEEDFFGVLLKAQQDSLQASAEQSDEEESEFLIPASTMKLLQFGSAIGRFLDSALSLGLATNMDIYRNLRLKPKYISDLIDGANKRAFGAASDA